MEVRASTDFTNTYFFTNRIVDLRNSLPNEVVSVQSLQAFKYKVFHLNL